MTKKSLIFVLLMIVALTLFAETRSLWVVPWSIANHRGVDELIEDAIAANQNELLIEVRYRSDALYEVNRGGDRFSNPEPRSYILKDDSFDPLDYTLKKAKPLGLKVQAWVVVYNATPSLPRLVDENHMFTQKPHWITWQKGKPMTDIKEQFGLFIDPGIPEVQDYLLDVFSDIVLGYPELDGLHLDYIRYPNHKYGYHPISTSRYEEALLEENNLSWNDWRIRQVSDFVGKLQTRIKEINPEILLTAAVFADLKEAKNTYAQDWHAWLRDGLIDIAYPMAYSLNYDSFMQQMEVEELLDYHDKIIVGLRAWDASGKNLKAKVSPKYNVNHIKTRIDYIRANDFAGISLFSYSGIKEGNALDDLVPIAYPPQEPAIQEIALNESLELDERIEPELTQIIDFLEVVSIESPDQEMIVSEATASLKNFKTQVKLFEMSGSYVLSMQLPKQGCWTWCISDKQGHTLYRRKRCFEEGYNEDYWLGNFYDGSHLQNQSYLISFYLEDEELFYQSIVIPEI